MAALLTSVDEWQFDSLRLTTASAGRPLSCLAFFLFKRSDLIAKFHLNETKLARFLMRIEEGYPSNPYHCRTHAADVLRSLHVVLNRGGVAASVVAASLCFQRQQEKDADGNMAKAQSFDRTNRQVCVQNKSQ
jgi:hypothetical protein